jgi:hypothetical protein
LVPDCQLVLLESRDVQKSGLLKLSVKATSINKYKLYLHINTQYNTIPSIIHYNN